MTTLSYQNHLAETKSLLFGFAMNLTRNNENAKDLMQETLMRSYKSKDVFKEGTNFKAWMTTIMYNSFISDYRKRKTRNKVLKPVEDFNYLIENNYVVGNPYSNIMMKELNGMVNNLTEINKIPFEMLIQGYHYDEIAETLNVPMGTIKSRIFHARKKLQVMVNNRYYDVEDIIAG